jgi:methionine-rich copper-binding protein CopC
MRRLAGAIALLGAWLLLWCSPALSHAELVRAEPAPGTTLKQPPGEVRLHLSEPVEAEFSPLEVYGPGGDRVDRNDARVAPEDARVVEVSLREGIDKGSYEVRWHVTSVDGHVIDGTYGFTVAAGGAREGAARPAAGREAAQQGESVPILLYSAVSLAILGVGALALLGVARARGRKP